MNRCLPAGESVVNESNDKRGCNAEGPLGEGVIRTVSGEGEAEGLDVELFGDASCWQCCITFSLSTLYATKNHTSPTMENRGNEVGESAMTVATVETLFVIIPCTCGRSNHSWHCEGLIVHVSVGSLCFEG